jgi:hypothetical protein
LTLIYFYAFLLVVIIVDYSKLDCDAFLLYCHLG